jgi:uncharacterized protein
VMASVTSFARKEGLLGAQITGVGALSEAVLGYFDWEKKEYLKIPVAEQVEVAALLGDIAQEDGSPAAHIHVVLGRRDGGTLSGHLLSGTVRPTLEIVLTEAPRHLRKRKDKESGLNLIDLEA